MHDNQPPISAPTSTSSPAEPVKLPRGFAILSPERRREISSLGGKASHAKGVGHEWNREEARTAGKKGGAASRGGRGKFG